MGYKSGSSRRRGRWQGDELTKQSLDPFPGPGQWAAPEQTLRALTILFEPSGSPSHHPALLTHFWGFLLTPSILQKLSLKSPKSEFLSIAVLFLFF